MNRLACLLAFCCLGPALAAQTFDIALLKKAFAKACAPSPDSQQPTPEFTDDASVVERAGHSVALVEGDPKNLKITRPMDLALAEYLLNQDA